MIAHVKVYVIFVEKLFIMTSLQESKNMNLNAIKIQINLINKIVKKEFRKASPNFNLIDELKIEKNNLINSISLPF